VSCRLYDIDEFEFIVTITTIDNAIDKNWAAVDMILVHKMIVKQS
jgi:hypothetical protein